MRALRAGSRDRGAAKPLFAARQVATHPIGVSRAFHSRLVADAVDSFLAVLESVEIAPSAIPVYSNSTADPYPVDARSARAVLAGQLAAPVDFVAEIEAMYCMGARTFLEIGPDAKLGALVRAILEGKEHHTLAVDNSRGASGNVADLACTLASLAAHGYAVDLTRWDPDAKPLPARRPGLTVKVCGANPRPAAAHASASQTACQRRGSPQESYHSDCTREKEHDATPCAVAPRAAAAPTAATA